MVNREVRVMQGMAMSTIQVLPFLPSVFFFSLNFFLFTLSKAIFNNVPTVNCISTLSTTCHV